MNKERRFQVFVAVTVILLALARLVFHVPLSPRMDATFFIVIGAGILLLLIPIESLKSFKAGGFEFSLEQPQVQGAISSLSLDRIKNERIVSELARLKAELVTVRGSRVLWIDDNPHAVVAERRVLRALGVDVITARSSDEAETILEGDNDFDLIVTDIQRKGDHFRKTGGIPIHDGVNFIITLRKDQVDPVISKVPVLFYAAYEWESLVKYTEQARRLYPQPEIANAEEDLIPKVVKLLAHSRAKPIIGSKRKIATPIRGRMDYVAPADVEEPVEGEEEEHFG